MNLLAALLLQLALLAAGLAPAPPPNPNAPTDIGGVLPDGAAWRIVAPKDWNGTLLLYSHGLVAPGALNTAAVAPDLPTTRTLLEDGYALAGSSYSSTGWAVEEALTDQLDLLDVFADQIGTPERTVAWGSSLGGLVTLGLLEQAPGRFDGGVSMCGPVAGTNAVWDSYLDVLFVLRTLLAPMSGIELASFETNPLLSVDALNDAVTAAEATPQGRARIALAAAIGGVPDDPAVIDRLVLYGIALRADLEHRSGGNPSTNEGVDYGELLASSAGRAEVDALYAAAGTDPTTDLVALTVTPKIPADLVARATAAAAFTPSGALQDPVLTLHTTRDGLAIHPHEGVLAQRVAAAGAGDLLRQTTTERFGHCTFTPAETRVVLDALLARVETGAWPDTSPPTLGPVAAMLGPALNLLTDVISGTVTPADPAFTDVAPGPYPGIGRP